MNETLEASAAEATAPAESSAEVLADNPSETESAEATAPPGTARPAGGRYKLLIALSCLLYFTSYITRLNYSASIAGILEATALTKEQTGLIGTALFITYGVGQIVSGLLGDKIRPERIILAGLVTTTLCNAVFPLFSHVAALVFVWGLNGFAQAMFWPPLVRILAEKLPEGKFTSACFFVSVSAQVANIVIYLLVPLLLVTAGWKSVFFIAAGFAALIAAVWVIGCRIVMRGPTIAHMRIRAEQPPETTSPAKEKQPIGFGKLLLLCGMPFILPAIAMQGFLKDGMTTWMPAYIADIFHLQASMAILSSIVMPIFSIVIVYLVSVLFKKVFRNELTASVCYFGVASAMNLLLFFFSDKSAGLSLTLAALSVGCMHGVNLMLPTYVPSHFAAYGKASTASGVTNAFTYVGSAASSYLIALLAAEIGWKYTILCWFAVAALGAILCVVAIRRWTKFRKQKSDS